MINNNNKKDDIVVSGLDQCGCGLYACCSQFSNSFSFLIRGILKKKKKVQRWMSTQMHGSLNLPKGVAKHYLKEV